jgi:O-antigen/teichoic acid export membrane protein
MFSIAKKDDAARGFSLVFRWYGIVLLFTAFGLSLISTVVLNLFFPPSYHSSAPIIPIIAVSIEFYGAYSIFTTGISVQRKTWFAVIFTSTSALVNVGLNLVLIPLYGSTGAALSTLLAYALLALLAYIVNQRIYPIPFEMGRFFVALGVGVGLYVGAGFLGQSRGTYVAWSIYLGALVLYAGCLATLAKLPARSQSLNRKNG